MEIEQVKVAELHEYEGNAKKHNAANIEAIEASIKEFGFREPIIAWHDGEGRAVIVAGHGRVKAAKRLGMETVPVVFADDLTDEQRRMLVHVDNQTSLMTGFEWTALQDELGELGDFFALEDFGFTALENVDIDDMFAALGEEPGEEPGGEPGTAKAVVCPRCGEVFEP